MQLEVIRSAAKFYKVFYVIIIVLKVKYFTTICITHRFIIGRSIRYVLCFVLIFLHFIGQGFVCGPTYLRP